MTVSNIIRGEGGNFLIPLAKLKFLNRQKQASHFKKITLYFYDHERWMKKKKKIMWDFFLFKELYREIPIFNIKDDCYNSKSCALNAWTQGKLFSSWFLREKGISKQITLKCFNNLVKIFICSFWVKICFLVSLMSVMC